MGKWNLGLLGLMCSLAFNVFGSNTRDSLIQESLKNTRDPRVLESLAQKMLSFSDDEMQARGYFVRGLAYNYGAKARESAVAYKKALSFMHPDTVYDLRFTYPVVLRNLGIAYYRSQNFRKGDSAFVALRDLAALKADSLGIAMAQKNMGNALMMRENYDSAVVLMRDAIQIQERLDYRGVPLSYMSMGSIFGRMAQPEEAIRWFRMALAKLKAGQSPDQRMEGRIYNNIAVAFRNMEQLDSAQHYLKEALAIHEGLGSVYDQVEVRANLARNAIDLGNYKDAHRFIDDALAAVDERNPRSNQVLRNISLLSFDLAVLEKDREQAEVWFTKISESMDMSRVKKDYRLMESFGAYYELMGQTDSALAYFKAADALQEDIQRQRDAEVIKKVANDAELIGLRSDGERLKARYRSIFGYSILVFSLGFLALWLYWRFRTKKASSASVAPANDGQFQFKDLNPVQEVMPGAVIENENAQLKLKSKAVISVSDIIYAQSEGHYVNIFLASKPNPEVDRSSLKALQDELEAYDFQRIHRTYIINCNYLKAVYATKVLLTDGTELPVSRTFKDELQARFKERKVS